MSFHSLVSFPCDSSPRTQSPALPAWKTPSHALKANSSIRFSKIPPLASLPRCKYHSIYGGALSSFTSESSSSLPQQLPQGYETNLESESESEVVQSCRTLCDPMDCSLPGSSVHGILQARILEWVTISFSRGSSQPRDRTQVSCIGGRYFNLGATRECHETNLGHL